MAGGRLMPMVLAGIRVGGIGWELNQRSHPNRILVKFWDISSSDQRQEFLCPKKYFMAIIRKSTIREFHVFAIC